MDNAMVLYEATELVSNNRDCVLIKLKKGKELELISTGYFNGDEAMLRLTKGDSVTCTVWTKDGKHYSWYWGLGGHTLVSDSMRMRGYIIRDCIQQYYKIICSRYA